MTPTEQLVKVAIQLGVGVTVYWLLRRHLRAAPSPTGSVSAASSIDPTNAARIAVEEMFGGKGVANAAIGLLARREAKMRRARNIGRVVIFLVGAYFVFVPLPLVLQQSSSELSLQQLGMLIFIGSTIATGARWLIAGRLYNPSGLVLLLRRFRGVDSRYTVLAEELRHTCAGIAVPWTVQDASFPGYPPALLTVAKGFIVPFVSLFLLLPAVLIATLIPLKALAIPVAVLLWAAGWFAVDRGSNRLIAHLGVLRTSTANAQEKLQQAVDRTRNRRGWYVGTRVVTFPDTAWQQGIEFLLAHADAVVIDVTDISEAVKWELRTVQRLSTAETVVLTWQVERESEKQLQQQAREALRLSSTPQTSDADPLPDHLRGTLLSILGGDWVNRCQKAKYERSTRRDRGSVALMRFSLLRAVCVALANRERSRMTNSALAVGNGS